MKKLFTSILALTMSVSLWAAEGWPGNYQGVMFQAFYWDSYSDTNWAVLESQANELSEYFNLIWVPQSGYCNTVSTNPGQMGYADIWWFNQNSCFGKDSELKSMISTFKDKGLLTIADVVINHKSGNTNWCDFPTETWNGKTITWSLADICNTDEAKAQGYNVTGANDTGSDFYGSRDLDHTRENVQKNIKLYLRFLMEEMGYAGFRYDMTGGYAPEYTKIYNESANPTYSVGEYWMDDGLTGLKNWINGTGKTSAAFDFQLKWLINDAFNSGSWDKLTGYASRSLAGSDYNRYAVTFVDNHDTGRESDKMLKANVEAANAYILTMPGTPCVWMTHWMGHKTAIKKMIKVRKLAGISNQSPITSSEGNANGYSVAVQGSKGTVLLLLGNLTVSTDGYKLATEGENYKMFVSNNIDISSLDGIGEETYQLPSFVTPQEGTYAYFEAPKNWGSTINVWAWNATDAQDNIYKTTWPGTASQKDITYVGTNDGKKVYLWKNSTAYTPTKIIFNDGGNQTSDLEFFNAGYYTVAGKQAIVTSINTITTDSNQAASRDNDAVFDLAGRKWSNGKWSDGTLPKGIYIHNGKKVVIK